MPHDENQNKIIVSIIIPCFNEASYIQTCLDAVMNNIAGRHDAEVLVIDGGSSDGTIDIVNTYCRKSENVRLLHNPKRIAPSAENIGIKNARGEFVVIVDAHAELCSKYIVTCVDYLRKHPQALGAGGAMITKPKKDSAVGRMVVQAITSPFGVGNSPFRTGKAELCWVDSVYSCCYPKAIYEQFGFYDERLPRGYDFEFHRRLRSSGRKFLYIPEICSAYYARSAFTPALLKFYYLEGFWAVYPYKIAGRKYLSLSHLVPAIFVLGLGAGAVLWLGMPQCKWFFLTIITAYGIGAVIAAIFAAAKHKTVFSIVALPALFFSIHICYGIGSLHAFIKRKHISGNADGILLQG